MVGGQEGVMEVETRKECAVCKKDIEGTIYYIVRSSICSACNKKDYINSGEVGKLLGINPVCISKYVLQNRKAIVPAPDARRCKSNLLWERGKILKFMETIPKVTRTQVAIMAELKMSHLEISEELGVDIFYINKTNRMNLGNSNSSKLRKSHKNRVDRIVGKEQYVLANKLLNNLVMP